MTIFISILAHEDPTLERTIRSAIDNAKNPDSLVFGLGLQYSDYPDLSFLPDNQKKIIEFDINKRPGVQRGRYLIKQLFTNEDFFLQIDSHSLFIKDWDIAMIDELNNIKQQTNNNKVVLSGYLGTEYGYFNRGTHTKWNIIDNFNDTGLFKFFVDEKASKLEDYSLFKSNWIYHGYLFADKNFVSDVLFDQYSQELMHEAYLSFYAYMKGYDIYERVNYYYISHNPEQYYLYIYGKEILPRYERSYSSPFFKESRFNHYEMCLSFIYNDYSKFKINNAVRTIEEFWLDIGLYNKFIFHKEKFDDRLFSEIPIT